MGSWNKGIQSKVATTHTVRSHIQWTSLVKRRGSLFYQHKNFRTTGSSCSSQQLSFTAVQKLSPVAFSWATLASEFLKRDVATPGGQPSLFTSKRGIAEERKNPLIVTSICDGPEAPELLTHRSVFNSSYDFRLCVKVSKKHGCRLLHEADVARPITLLILQIMNS